MKSSRTLFPRASRHFAVALAAAWLLLALLPARAVMAEGKMTQDLTVGANKDVPLKTGQVVQIMNQNGSKTVIMVPLPDGSNGIFQIASSAIQPVPAGTPLGLPPPPPKPPPAPGTVPPAYPDAFAGVATVQTTQGTHTSGMAGIITAPDGQHYILSSRQLLGPLGGFQDQVAAKDVPTAMQSIKVATPSGTAKTYTVSGLPMPTDRLSPQGGSPTDDMAIYRINSAATDTPAVALADQPPAVGDIVWVVAKMRGSADGELAQRGQVTANTQWLEMQFDNDSIVTQGATGAPVLNNAGQLVGVFSSTLTGGGHIRGYLIPAPLIAKTIAANPPPPPAH